MPVSTEIVVCSKCRQQDLYGGTRCRACGNLLAPKPRRSPLKNPAVRIALILLFFAIGICGYLYVQLVHSDAYQQALNLALSSKQVQAALGDGIRANRPAYGYLIPSVDAEFAQWSVSLTGNRSRGHLYAVANRTSGDWEYSRLVFESSSHDVRIDLTPVRQLALPKMPPKNVYLVPVGFDQSQSLSWAPAYYKSKLGIEVTVLPSVPLDPALIDRKRNQLNGDKCIAMVQRMNPELARDPSAVLVAVTSSDMYIPSLDWSYAENLRSEGRFVVISSARLHPPLLLGWLNPEWLNSRLQKLLTKNIMMLYFDLPMSSDSSSILSGGVLSGPQIDQMGGDLIGTEGQWEPFYESGGPVVTLYESPGKRPFWRLQQSQSTLSDTHQQVFSAVLSIGLLVQRKTDFFFEDEPSLLFSRVYRNADDRSRAFGIGGSHAFDIFLGGQMGVAVDLINEEGSRVHYVHETDNHGQPGDRYRETWGGGGRFAGTEAVFMSGTWEIKTNDGWTYFFPYRPQALPQYVTVLTSFIDPEQHKYEMERDSSGALLSVSSPSGKWLRFENDAAHRIRSIHASSGRTVTYEYDDTGHLIQAKCSDGEVDSYTFDDRGRMLTAFHGNAAPVMTNEYSSDNYIKAQTMSDGEKISYSYFRVGDSIRENQITDPNGLETYIQYEDGGYLRWLPRRVPQ